MCSAALETSCLDKQKKGKKTPVIMQGKVKGDRA